MKKVDLFVYGNIFFKRDVQAEKNGSVESGVSDVQIDLSDAIIVDGNMIVDYINFGKKIVCCTGDIIKLSEKDILLQRMISAEELPEEGTMVVAHSPNGRYDVLKFQDGIFIDELGQQHCVDFFIPIYQVNPEKEER